MIRGHTFHRLFDGNTTVMDVATYNTQMRHYTKLFSGPGLKMKFQGGPVTNTSYHPFLIQDISQVQLSQFLFVCIISILNFIYL